MRSAVYFIKSSLFVTMLLSAMLFSGCKLKLIPSTNVPPTTENKQVVKFLEQYKAAVEKKSADGVMELVAKDYQDNMGSEDPSLRLNYLTLQMELEKAFALVNEIQLVMFVQHIGRLSPDTYEVVIYFNEPFLLQTPSREKWFPPKDVSRMVIRRRRDKDSPYQFEILQGI